MRILPQASQDVLEVDDRVIDEHAEGDGEPTERQRVQREAEVLEHDDRCKQR